MCGIAGIVSFNQSSEKLVSGIARMCFSMRQRGPDDEGYVLRAANGQMQVYGGDDTAQSAFDSTRYPYLPNSGLTSALGGNYNLAFGHRRLSILDLSERGHQPICDSENRYWMVFNGEIYNFECIARRLTTAGVAVSGTSDTEVVIMSYATWGAECLQFFNGDFSIAIWDNVKQELFCARDRLGIRPFFFVQTESEFVFASDIKSIICSGFYNPAVNTEGLYDTMAFGASAHPQTAFDAVYALEPGYWLKIDAGGNCKKQQYWDIPDNCQDKSMTESQAVELLEESLLNSVKLRLKADVPVATFLSGGVDSTTVTGMAARFHPTIKSFTLAYKDAPKDFDETEQASATARMYEINHVIHRVDRDSTLHKLEDWILGFEVPYYSLSPNQIISQLAAEGGAKVVLNGLGGDELFGGYGYYKVARQWNTLSKMRFFRALLPERMAGKVKLLKQVLDCDSPSELYVSLYQHLSDLKLRTISSCDSDNLWVSKEKMSELYLGKKCFDDAVATMNYMDIKMRIGNHHVQRIDQFTMAQSIEGRFPFLDHELVEKSFTIPSQFKVTRYEQKAVLRSVASRYIHPSCLNMEKKGFGTPLGQWMDGPLSDLVTDCVTQLKTRSMVNSTEFDRLLVDYRNRVISPTFLWQFIALELWLQYFVDNSGALVKRLKLQGLNEVFS